MIKEEVTFSNTNVTSLDWNSYPVLRFAESPTVTPIVVQRLEQPSSGGGEEVLGPAAAAIANALYDATGVRFTRIPAHASPSSDRARRSYEVVATHMIWPLLQRFWMRKAFSVVPTKLFTVRFCLSALKNSSICQRSL